MINFVVNWWKIMVLQIIITAATHSTGLELGDYSKLSNGNIISLFNKFLEDIKHQHYKEETNDKFEQINDFYQTSSLTPLNRKLNLGKFVENEIKNDNIQQLAYEDFSVVDNAENVNKKRGKNQYMALCHFKICNKKKSVNDYNNFIRYVKRNFYQQQF